MDGFRRYAVEGMHCQACADRLTAALSAVAGVTSARVDLGSKSAEVAGDADEAAVAREARRAGYPITRMSAEGASVVTPGAATDEPPTSLYPLGLIVAYLLGVTVLVAAAAGDGWHVWPMMRTFMAGFFITFSFFKLLNLRGFVTAYRQYDLLARAVPGWAWVYPFVELGLGVAYALNLWPMVVNGVALALMAVGAVGVLLALRRGQRLRCACLGTALNLPMTTVTLVEDLVMAAMAGAMLLTGR